MMTETPEARGLTLRQRREIGLTLRNCIRVARGLNRDDELSDDPDIAAGQIAVALAGENPQAFVGVDWDAILEFIEKLIPLIMKIIALFGGI
jgi:hypothetical protein